MLNQHTLPAFGHSKVTDLRPEDVEQLLDHMAANGYAGRSVRLTLALIRRLGERRSIVIRNVAAVVGAPAAGPASIRAGLAPDEARALLSAADGDRFAGLVTVSLLLGLRPGEAAGLTWRALDLESEPATLSSPTACAATANPHACAAEDTHQLPNPGIPPHLHPGSDPPTRPD